MKTKQKKLKNDIERMTNVFNGSSILLGLCITSVSLFQISNKRAPHIVDDLLVISSFLFALSLLFAYLFIRGEKKMIYKILADIFFLTALWVVFVIGILFVLDAN